MHRDTQSINSGFYVSFRDALVQSSFAGEKGVFPVFYFPSCEVFDLIPSTVLRPENSASPLHPRVALALAVAPWRGARRYSIVGVMKG